MMRTWSRGAAAAFLALTLGVACGGYDACAGKDCGDPCTVCDPDDSRCVETAQERACNANGVCATAMPPVCN